MEDQDHPLRSAGGRPLTPGMSRQAVPNSNHSIRVGTDRQMPLQWTAGKRKYRPFAEGLANRANRPYADLHVYLMNGRTASRSGHPDCRANNQSSEE